MIEKFFCLCGETQMKQIKRILVATDFSDCSKEAYAEAIQLARQLKGTVLLTHVIEPIGSVHIEPLAYLELKAGQALDRMVHPAREEGIKVETHLFKGDPAAEIIKAAEDLQCDLIVMGTHGRTGIPRLLMGSVTERVLRASPVPIVAVRQRPVAEKKKTLAKEETAAA
jgi:nucleotide-binding universal stress UspA family protein